ncbi:hypothetical protein CKO40_06370 [Halochromatium glycolicum]|uniref:Uncharacterized protein n=1 Tax=Halochromatium glycolicum TaxID=85075 RepID=A0AAJ0X9V9_9GAMM|nr:hypothetical protein [Halochromatium glycolicum]
MVCFSEVSHKASPLGQDRSRDCEPRARAGRRASTKRCANGGSSVTVNERRGARAADRGDIAGGQRLQHLQVPCNQFRQLGRGLGIPKTKSIIWSISPPASASVIAW